MSGWSPHHQHQRLSDLEQLSTLEPFCGCSHELTSGLWPLLEVRELAVGEVLSSEEGEDPRQAFWLLTGSLRHNSHGHAGPELIGGETLAGAGAVAPLTATEPSRVVRLTFERFLRFVSQNPEAGLSLAARLTRGPEPAHPTTAAELLGPGQDQCLAVRVEGLTIPLDATVPRASRIEPVTLDDWEGREIFRRGASLVCLEALRSLRVAVIGLGPSWTSGRLIELTEAPTDPAELAKLAGQVTQRMTELCAARGHFDELVVGQAEALALLERANNLPACELLESFSDRFVVLTRFGETVVLSPGALPQHSGNVMGGFVVPHQGGLALDYGPGVRKQLAKRPHQTLMLEQERPRYGAAMTEGSRAWLRSLGVTTLGAFNRTCIDGTVREIIDLAEGYHEKNIAHLADRIASIPNVRLICVSGPSSSGKTTFLRRLRIQLRVNGIEPVGLSLDDYYVDREKNVRDERGEYDFEALEALDLELLPRHLERLLAGEKVKTAHYDFVTGKSHPEGGPELELSDHAMLVMEGIHGLNPKLLPPSAEGRVFRIFIHPATSLPFDLLSTLEPADVRLLRRIVRDRYGRATSAAQNLARWRSVRRGERLHIDPQRPLADEVFDSSLVYELSVLKVYAERYLLEVPRSAPEFAGAMRLRRLMAPIVPIYPDRVPPTSILREFIGGSGFRP